MTKKKAEGGGKGEEKGGWQGAAIHGKAGLMSGLIHKRLIMACKIRGWAAGLITCVRVGLGRGTGGGKEGDKKAPPGSEKMEVERDGLGGVRVRGD